MAKFVDVLFSEFVPDRGGSPFANDVGYLTQAENVIWCPEGYRAAKVDSSVTSTTAVVATATPATAVSFGTFAYNGKGNTDIYVGLNDSSNLGAIYASDDGGQTWSNVTRATAYATTYNWDFDVYQDQLIAVPTGSDPPQHQDRSGSGTTTTTFTDLSAAAPSSTGITVLGDHAILYGPSSLQWSTLGDVTSWPTPGTSTALADQAGSNVMPAVFGSVKKVLAINQRSAVVFQEVGASLMTYVGGDVQYDFNYNFSRGIGTIGAKTAINISGIAYFLNYSGLFRTDGYRVERISVGKVEAALIRNLLSYPDSLATFSSVAYDADENRITWINSAGTHALTFDLGTGNFEVIQLTTTAAASTLFSSGYTGGLTRGADQVFYLTTGSAPKLRAINSLSSVAVELQTSYMELEPGYLVQVTGLQPLGSGVSPALAIKSTSAVASINVARTGFTTATTSSRTDVQGVRTDAARFHCIRWTDTADSTHLIRGVRVYYERVSRT